MGTARCVPPLQLAQFAHLHQPRPVRLQQGSSWPTMRLNGENWTKIHHQVLGNKSLFTTGSPARTIAAIFILNGFGFAKLGTITASTEVKKTICQFPLFHDNLYQNLWQQQSVVDTVGSISPRLANTQFISNEKKKFRMPEIKQKHHKIIATRANIDQWSNTRAMIRQVDWYAHWIIKSKSVFLRVFIPT